MRSFARGAPLLSFVLPLLALVPACGGDGQSGVECGPGTHAEGHTCVPDDGPLECADGTVLFEGGCVPESDLCPQGQAWVGGECIDRVECSEGTLHGPNGDCVAACEGDLVWNGTECVEPGCGPGFVNVDGECVDIGDLCEDGEVYSDGECRPERGCGDGTVEIGGVCTPDLPPDVNEAAEPNDLAFGGEPTPFSLPATNDDAILLGGTLAASVDLDGDGVDDADYDSFVFDGAAGRRLQIEATALGAPVVGFVLRHRDSPGVPYEVFGTAVGSRNAAREVVLPATGRYELAVASLRFEPGRGPTLLDVGSEGFTYLVAVTPVAAPAPISRSTATFFEPGDAAEVPRILVGAPTGTVVELSLDTDASDFAPFLWTATADSLTFLGAFEAGLRRVPEGGLLVTVDYRYAGTSDTAVTLRARALPPAPVAPPATLDGETIPLFASTLYRVVLGQVSVLSASIARSEDTFPELSVLDSDLALVAVAGGEEPAVASTAAALDAGAAYLYVQDKSTPDTLGGPVVYDLSVDAAPVLPIGTALGQSLAHAELLASAPLAATGDAAFFSFETDALGMVTMSVDPGADLDVSVELYEGRVLAPAGAFAPDAVVDGGGAGEAEAYTALLPPGRVLVRLVAEDLAESAVDADVQFDVDLEEPESTWVLESEPNDTAAQATVLGTLGDPPLNGAGTFRDRQAATGLTTDYYAFTVDSAATVTVGAAPLGLSPAPSLRLVLRDDTLHWVAEPAGAAPTLEVSLEAGTYLIEVFEASHAPAGWYQLTVARAAAE